MVMEGMVHAALVDDLPHLPIAEHGHSLVAVFVVYEGYPVDQCRGPRRHQKKKAALGGPEIDILFP
jgi:hypothetical protein